MTLKLAARTEGPIAVALADEASALTVPPGRPVTTWLAVTTSTVGQAHVRVEASAASATGTPLLAAVEADLPVRPAGPLHAESSLFHIKAGEPFKLESPSTFLPGSTRTTLSLSASFSRIADF